MKIDSVFVQMQEYREGKKLCNMWFQLIPQLSNLNFTNIFLDYLCTVKHNNFEVAINFIEKLLIENFCYIIKAKAL